MQCKELLNIFRRVTLENSCSAGGVFSKFPAYILWLIWQRIHDRRHHLYGVKAGTDDM